MRNHSIVVDLGFGDAGKGSIVDYLTSMSVPIENRGKVVVRFNGGAQAGHRVVHAGAGTHVFSQFGSGFFNHAATYLSRFMLVDPLALITEAEHLQYPSVGPPLNRVMIDRRALLTTPFHSAANKAKEVARGDARHGSCGMGIGETMAFSIANPDDAPTVADTQDTKVLRRKLWALHDYYRDIIPAKDTPPIDLLIEVYKSFASVAHMVDENFLPLALQNSNVVFEGAQGVLLDEWFGTYPYNSWSKTSFANAQTLLDEAGYTDPVKRIGVTRTYMVRHGAGPFPTENELLTAKLPDAANVEGPWQGKFRVGELDLVLLRYALKVAGRVDALAVTHMDKLRLLTEGFANHYFIDGQRVDDIHTPSAKNFVYQQDLTERLMRANAVILPGDPMEALRSLDIPIEIESHGPKSAHKQRHVAVAA